MVAQHAREPLNADVHGDPVFVYEDVGEAVEWLCDTFGFTERWRAGSHRAQLAVGEGAVVVTEQRVVEGATEVLPPPGGEHSHSVMAPEEWGGRSGTSE